jgi:hypothetical protein
MDDVDEIFSATLVCFFDGMRMYEIGSDIEGGSVI